MRSCNRILLIVIVMLSVACQKSEGAGSGRDEDAVAMAGAASNGDYEGIGTFLTNIQVVDLGSNTPPVQADCTGDVEIVLDDGAADELVGNGQCLTPSNFASYDLIGGFTSDVDFEGEITIHFSGVDHVLDFAGSLSNDQLSATFADRTPQVGNLVIDWDGAFTADRI